MPRRRHNPERDVVGAGLFVRLGDGFLEISPAVLPGSASRFYRGRAAIDTARGRFDVVSAGTTPTVGPRSPRAAAAAGKARHVVLGAGLISAAPARADHGPDVGFHFFFGLPFPPVPVFPVPVYEPPRCYQPRVVYEEPPVYYAPRVYYNERPHRYWRDDRHWRGGRDGGWHDRRGHDRHHD